MKKQTFIQGTIILIVVGMIVKILGLVNKMLIARFLTSEGIGIYMMVMPTCILLIALAQLGFPVAISKLVSENNIKHRLSNRTIVMQAVKISIINSVILIIGLILSAKVLANFLLHDSRTYYPLLSLVIFIPLVSFTSILRGYLHGYKIISVPSYSQLVEQIVRMGTSILLIILLLPISVELAVTGVVLSLSFGELASLIYMLYKIKNKRSWNTILKQCEGDYPHDGNLSKEILSISIPATGSRLVGSLSHFLEPIIFSFALTSIGFNSLYVTKVYGQITGYTISLLLVPSFFSFALATPLIPVISEAYVKKQYQKITHYFNLSLFLSFIIGGLFTVIITLYPKELMKLFFNTTEGVEFLSYMAPLFIIHYFQQPITSTLHALNQAKHALFSTLSGAIIKLSLIFILASNPAINVHGLTIAVLLNSLIVTVLDYLFLAKIIKTDVNIRTILQSVFMVIIIYLLGLIGRSQHINPYLNIIIVSGIYLLMLFGLNIGDIRKIKGQLFTPSSR